MPDRATLLHNSDALVAHYRAILTPPTPADDPQLRAARPSAVLIPIHADAGGAPHVLFTQRSGQLKNHSGQISFPGGRMDPEDASLRAAALREAQEEIGLAPDRVEILGELPGVFTVVSNFLITPFVARAHGTLREIAPAVNAAEVERLIDVPFAHLADPAQSHQEIWERDGRRFPVYFYQFGDHRIWGATAHIVTLLLRLLPES
jgi:8-oxo-dGTP pyrophosphatase MutT (NUDIX family)